MPDRFEDGRRALDTVDPPGRWEEVEARAAGPAALELQDSTPPRRAALLAAAGLLTALAVAAALVGLRGGGDQRVAVEPSPTALEGPRWDLVELTADDRVEVDSGLDISGAWLQFEDGELRASDGCNEGSGPYAIADGRLVLGSWFSTTAACLEPDDQARSEIVYELITGQPSIRIEQGGISDVHEVSDGGVTGTTDAGGLVLERGGVRARFLPLGELDPPTPETTDASLDGTRWQLEAADGEPARALAILQLADGELWVHDGCGQAGGSYTTDGERLVIDHLFSHEATCAGEAGRVAEAVQRTLLAWPIIGRQGPQLSLTSADGTLELTALADSVVELAGTTWELEERHATPGGDPPEWEVRLEATVRFEDRTFTASVRSCPDVIGSYVADGDQLLVVEARKRSAGCGDEAMGELADALFRLLTSSPTMRLDGARLVLTVDGIELWFRDT